MAAPSNGSHSSNGTACPLELLGDYESNEDFGGRRKGSKRVQRVCINSDKVSNNSSEVNSSGYRSRMVAAAGAAAADKHP